ncbi:unnamed protein product [Gadus morhua 'NCC']
MPLTHFEMRGRRERTQGQDSVVTNNPSSLLVLKVHFWTTRFLSGKASIVPCYLGTALVGNHWTVVAAMVFEGGQQSQLRWVLWTAYLRAGAGAVVGVQVVRMLGVLGVFCIKAVH